MKLELDGKFISSFNYELPNKPPDNIEYKPAFNLTIGDADKQNNVIFAAFKCSLFNEEANITFNFKYNFFFRYDPKNTIEEHENELKKKLYLICVPYISEFIDYIISKSPLPPLNVTNTELPNCNIT